MRGRVLVTRPQPGAGRTARRLADAGFEPVVLPLTEIHSLPLNWWPAPAAAVAATSANAIRHAPRELISELAGEPLFAVGARTALAARSAGFVSVFEAAGDATDLAHRVIAALHPGARVLYLCGRVRRNGLEAALAGAGLTIDAVETYDTLRVSHTTDFVRSTLRNEPIGAALVFSAVGAEEMVTLAKRADLVHLFEDTSYFCISNRAAAVLAAEGWDRVYTAGTPDEDALISLLERDG